MTVLQNVELIAAAAALVFLMFFSIIESAIDQSNFLTLRMMAEKPEDRSSRLLSVVLENKNRILLPLYFGIQMTTLVVIVLISHLCMHLLPDYGLAAAFGVNILIVILLRQFLPHLLTQADPELKLANLLAAFRPVHLILWPIVSPFDKVLNWRSTRLELENGGDASEDDEATEEEIQAYLQAGEDEGILEEEDTKRIQSVVEFGNTLVREVMTPRTKIVACDEKTTLSELRDLMVKRRHSRIPIYRGDIDHIVGIAHIRRLLAQYVNGKENDPITGIIRPVISVPETKPVAKLLEELQERGDYTAIVIDEFGGVAGLVTIEDLVEEIVGEIWDEDEARVRQVTKEEEGVFVVRGSAEISSIEGL
ncbi:MAG: hemolysin family protein, partial [Acidobacteriota bacterium]|nr:hemolysin family protein [Acidobacteriota bacterium]